ncbi:transcriptional regulator, TetR family [Gluconacetobacter diazotrophicus PA1 5]|uniref:TetR/AcrR family transcriptional regulator n=2 Tax=Gluconacetobacter diazotrophicus TaxID=33996 RepID=A0A7W4I3S4_GLUDI|nr:transcriptional regulator, TetR family [Gluconacetobacter diazotrophicus PA1 5]MBB2155207.1 TetR/AcrR family transcriptional regulator [Gluconacetobacter diazotrophicus]CAP55226.1 putative transcriptional regulator [Gluconacetobacter diazotrophicus PA1 5]
MRPCPDEAVAQGPEKRCPGRPPVLEEGERREMILNAACQVLDDHGYQSASMDKLAQQSGMSKKTIYQMFPSKHDLFRTLISERLFDMKHASVCPCRDLPPEEELVQILTSIAANALQADRMCLIRAIVGEIRDSAEIRKIMQDIEISGNCNQVEAWLRRQQAAGTYMIDDVEDLGHGLFSMTVGKLILAELFHCRDPATPAEIEANIRRWIRIFLGGLEQIVY